MPSETFSQHCIKAGETPLGSDKKLSSEPRFSSWISIMPTDSTLNRLLYNSPEYEASFPRMEGTLFLPVEGKQILFGVYFLVSVAFLSSRPGHTFVFFRISSSPGSRFTLKRCLSKIIDTTGKDRTLV